MKRFKKKKVISEAVKPIPFEFCQDCWHAVHEWHECVKVKFKMFKQIDESKIFTVTDYCKKTMMHTIVNRYWTAYIINLHRDIGFVDWYSLIWKQIVRKVKKSLSKK